MLSDGNDVVDVTQDIVNVPTNGEFSIALDVETANKKFGIATIIENRDCIGLIGNTATLSFKAKVTSTTKLDNVKAAIVSWSGTADVVTSDIISVWGAEGTNPTLIANATYENTPVNLNVTTGFTSFSITAPIDTASTQNIILFIWSDVTDTTAGDFLNVAEAKLELGSTATAFQYAGGTFAGEFAACQRYFYKITANTFTSGYINDSTEARSLLTFPQIMRATPTATLNASSNTIMQATSSGVTDTGNSALTLSEKNMWLSTTTSSVLTTGRAIMVSFDTSSTNAIGAEL